ncbi:MAG: alanine--tRNA ligase [Planctomycetaceae bacterium]|nr:MAG: alanine--tRNA ligase [Planctomycetaceae bacterium]
MSKTPKTCKEIRSEFVKFFEERGHTFVPSSSLLPADDPTLLFTNAGMNQFKDIFLGLAKRDYVRAVNSQKCIRAGGKHNDLEDVGHDTYHHTFFEMLGNWSFGDYFKEDAIRWAWELLTSVWGLPKERLHVTVFGGDPSEKLAPDTEAADLWKKVTDIDPTHIHMGNKKDNFWEMGETGPCGPCSEIHYDFTDDFSGGPLVNAGDARVMEIWNLVFMQFNRGGDGKLTPLPATHVDTGMGLERIARILQGVGSNYDIDIFHSLFDAIRAGGAFKPYCGGLTDITDVAYRVVADHARSLTFTIADGVIPSNEGRGYVLRRILRRAARYGRQYLKIDGPFIHKLVPTIVAMMGDVFPELNDRQKYVMQTIREEEESFGKTLDRGIDLFNKQARKVRSAGKNELSGEVAFDLYATYGFPLDLTQIMAAEAGLKVDVAGYDAAMARHRETSAAGETFKAESVANLPATDDSAKYSRLASDAVVLGWVVEGKFVNEGHLEPGDEAALVLDRTNFYGEQGGQVGDAGAIDGPAGVFVVRNTVLAGQCVLHVGVMETGSLHVGQKVTATIDTSRMDTMRNHTATHLLNWALRKVLGDHINQAGSIVSPDRLRFDFSHNAAMTAEQLQTVETLVNERVLSDEAVSVQVMPLADAKKIAGVRAVFGEKYPDPVRVVAIGGQADIGGAEAADAMSTAAEFCGGTHLERTSQVGLFKILAEESVAKGVRRVTAVTGREAVRYVQSQADTVAQIAALLRTSAAELPQRVAGLQKEIKELKKAPKGPAAGGQEFTAVATIESPAGQILVGKSDIADVGELRNLCDRLRQKGAAAIFVGAAAEDKVTLICMVSDELVKAGKIKAGDWVKAIAPTVGGSGGGKPTMAQAGGKTPEKLDEALTAAAAWVKERA